MLSVCREEADSEPAASVTDIKQLSKAGVRSCHMPYGASADVPLKLVSPYNIVTEVEMYQALYRKWRPRRFDDVAGQEHITETLKRQVISGKLSHAYLFTGTRGTGKTTCAKILAKAVNCENPENGNPCNKCPSCLGIDNGSIMDVTEMDAASNNGVDNVRALREEAVYMPTAVKKRVYIIDEVHMLSNQAFNALLKIMEEPPAHLMFILATTEYHKVPATILSRCQKYAFKRIDPSVIIKNLNHIASEEGLSLTDEASQLLARLADGSLRDAHSLLDQCSGKKVIDRQHVLECVGIAEYDEICRLLEDILSGNGYGALERMNALYISGKDVSSVLGQLAALHRDILITMISPKSGSGLLSGTFRDGDIAGFSKAVTKSRLLSNLEILQSTLITLDSSANRKTAAEICLLRLTDYGGSGENHPARAPDNSKEQTELAHVHEKKDSFAPPPERTEPEKTAEASSRVDNTDIDNASEQVAQDGEYKAPFPGGQEHSWKELLNSLSKKMDDNLYNILEDITHSEARITGNNIAISAKSPFSFNQINEQEVKETIKAAAESIWGGIFTVSVSEAQPDEAEMKSKLEKLSRFDNIRFE